MAKRQPTATPGPSAPPKRVEAERLRALGIAVLETEAEALLGLRERLDDAFVAACQHMLKCPGRIVVVGMGKSGHIAGKIAATLASTGTPAFFVHPGEASHGDLGMITVQDVVLALSNSGETDEILTILPIIKRLDVPLVALTGNPASTLGRQATVCLDVGVAREACPLGLAPTASTTAALAMGDALAVALLEARGFSADDFARSHPAGRLGRRLLLLVDDLLHTGADLPVVEESALVADALLEMTAKRLGMTAVVDGEGLLSGIFTDGDLRRGLDRDIDVHRTRVAEAMTRDCKTVAPGTLAAEALHMMQTHKINALLVVDHERRPVGALNIHDLLRSGVL
ncbi:MAG: KpsF/GutQ family sugar-phosphate isomerase [Gammaproteobacteria bacterium]|nr:KpsF/GutQ family sugar-phosphate isomerase [Gammaproteobacteria bacterium]